MHKYTNPRTFVVKCECSSSSGQTHFRAHKTVTIQEPVREIGAIRCYTRKKSFSETKCTALRGEAFQIQMGVKAGEHSFCLTQFSPHIFNIFVFNLS